MTPYGPKMGPNGPIISWARGPILWAHTDPSWRHMGPYGSIGVHMDTSLGYKLGVTLRGTNKQISEI